MSGQRRSTTETINDITEVQLDRIMESAKGRMLSLEEVQILKVFADIWANHKGRDHRGKDNFGVSKRVTDENLVKYAKGK